jgi:type VI secretion system Hcp family effector
MIVKEMRKLILQFGTIMLFVCIALLSGISQVHAAPPDIYAKVQDTEGESKDAEHEGWIIIKAVDFGVDMPIPNSPAQSGQRASGTANFGEFKIFKEFDRATPGLFKACSNGRPYTEDVIIDFVEPMGTSKLVYLRIRLSETIVSEVRYQVGTEGTVLETVTLNYAKIISEYTPQGNGQPGGVIVSGWDLQKNQECGSFNYATFNYSNTDGDGKPDGSVDTDGDTFINLDEYLNGLDPTIPEEAIATVVGNGTDGYSGDGGAAMSAMIKNPSGAAVDSSGNLYIADYYNNRIRKVDTSGVITTVAGIDGKGGFSGDGGAATSAKLYYPHSVALDTSGNLYIADSQNHRIRRVDKKTRVITTVAGIDGKGGFSGDRGAAISAQLNYPHGVALDTLDNLYIADTFNHRIRRVDTSGVITTFAGTGKGGFSGDRGAATSANLFFPHGVALDTSGNLYIADSQNHRIRRVDKKSREITTVAGTGTADYLGDDGLAKNANLNRPSGVALDTLDNLYIADLYNHCIRKVDKTTDVITTVAGTGTADYSGDGGPAKDAQLNYPRGVVLDSSGNLYISDSNNHRIRKVISITE